MAMGREVDDAQAAARGWGTHPGLPLTLFGFSFGGFVAASLGGAWKRGRGVAQLFMVAPAVMRLDVELPQTAR
jgi:alpha/beta superfamily hydrolase